MLINYNHILKSSCKLWALLVSFIFLHASLLRAQNPNLVWQHLSNATGDVPLPWNCTEQTSALIVDLDKDGVNDFVSSCCEVPPILVWYRRATNGWQRYLLEKEFKTIEAGGAFFDIDDDGDPDLVYGQDWQGPENTDDNL